MAERKRRREQKFEELIAAIYEFEQWMDNLKNALAYGEERPPAVSPLAKLEAIAAVYFPAFLERITALDRA